MVLFVPIAGGRESPGSVYTEWGGDSCSSPADLTFFLSTISHQISCSFWYFCLITPFQRRFFLLSLVPRTFLSDLSSIFRTQWSRKTMLVFGGQGKGGKLVEVVSRWSGPDWSNLFPQGGSKGLASAGRAACTPCAKKSPTQTHSSFGSAQVMAITAPGRK